MKQYLCCLYLFSSALFADANPIDPLTQSVIKENEWFRLETFSKNRIDTFATEKTAVIEPFAIEDLQPQKINNPTVLQTPEAADFTPIIETPYTSPLIATTLSAIVPGLGHIYLEDPLQASTYFSVYWASKMYATPDWVETAEGGHWKHYPYQEDSRILTVNSYLYSIYAAYRDARIANSGFSYRYDIPKDTLSALTYAPFSPAIITKPEVWGGVLGLFSVAMVVANIAYCDAQTVPTMNTSEEYMALPLSAFTVGIGEEAFFRGVIQSALIEETNPVLGIFLSSALFGLAHAGNAYTLPEEIQQKYYLFSMPLITAAGGYFGYLTYKNQSLQEAVAVHGWYDFILFAISYCLQDSLTEQEACIQKPQHWSFSWSF